MEEDLQGRVCHALMLVVTRITLPTAVVQTLVALHRVHRVL